GNALRPPRDPHQQAGARRRNSHHRRGRRRRLDRVQLARRLTGLTVVTTASRPETRQWCLDLGAHHVIDHRQKLVDQVAALGMTSVEYIFSITNTDQHFAQIVELVAPQGKFGLIDDPPTLEALPFKRKAVSIHWESM